MTSNLSSFLRFKYSSSNKGGSTGGPGTNEEQDLGGFDSSASLGGGSSPSLAKSAASAREAREAMEKRGMGTIQEGADEDSSPGSRRSETRR